MLGLTHATAIAAGEDFTCALASAGSVRCWGAYASGQLGNGSGQPSYLPVTVAGLTGASVLSIGGDNGCAIVKGHAFCWGADNYGQIGDSSSATTPRPTPVAVAKLGVSTELSAGLTHQCARLATGSLRCWGDNSDGGLGDGSTTNSSVPVPVTG